MTTSNQATPFNKNENDATKTTVDETSQDQAGTNLENAEASRKAFELFERNITNGSGSTADNIADIKKQRLLVRGRLAFVETAIVKIVTELKSSGQRNGEGVVIKLSPFEKNVLRREKRNLTDAKKEYKAQISELSKLFSSLDKEEAKKERKASISKSAKKEPYHKQHGGAVKNAIANEVTAMGKGNRDTLKVELAKLDDKGGDALIMKTLMKAPRFLHTRVVANADHRILYLQHFRTELGVEKKERPKRGRNKK